MRTLPLTLLTLTLAACASPMQGFDMPLDQAAQRPNPLHFGLYVTPEKNPITPAERFTGFHAAQDFEIFSSELANDVPVYAACDGTVLLSEFAAGYGGVLVQSCTFKGQDVTVLYGHLAMASLLPKATVVTKGQRIAVLGEAYTHDTDGNRKHLHFSIHKGTNPVLLGYVQTAAELKAYVDPAAVLGIHVVNAPFTFPGAKPSASGSIK